MKPYQRATPIGHWTGKIMIGGHYQPKVREMTSNECFIQGIIRGKGLPMDQAATDVWLKIKSIFTNTIDCIKSK